MSRHVQFDFGLAKYDFLPILLMGLDSIIVILVWLLLRDLGWICLLLGGIVFFGLANAIRCAAGMRVTATENGLTIHRTGKFGEPLTLLYEDIGYVERILSSTCILVWTYQGQLLWIGPFQYFSGTKEHRRADSDNLRACAHIREGEVPADADIRQVPVKTRIQ
jgi:hypothetical protein